MIYKAVIFDAGGVLQTYEVMQPIYEDICKTLDISYEQFREVWNEYSDTLGRGEVDETEFWHELVTRTGTKKELPQESLLLREYKTHFQINQETLIIVNLLKERGYKLAILTNTIKVHSEYNKEAGLYAPFDVQVLSDEIGVKKPDKKGFEICLDAQTLVLDLTIFALHVDKMIDTTVLGWCDMPPVAELIKNPVFYMASLATDYLVAECFTRYIREYRGATAQACPVVLNPVSLRAVPGSQDILKAACANPSFTGIVIDTKGTGETMDSMINLSMNTFPNAQVINGLKG